MCYKAKRLLLRTKNNLKLNSLNTWIPSLKSFDGNVRYLLDEVAEEQRRLQEQYVASSPNSAGSQLSVLGLGCRDNLTLRDGLLFLFGNPSFKFKVAITEKVWGFESLPSAKPTRRGPHSEPYRVLVQVTVVILCKYDVKVFICQIITCMNLTIGFCSRG